MKRIDKYTRAAITHYNLSRYVQMSCSLFYRCAYSQMNTSWVTFRMDILAALYTTSLAVYLTYFSPLSASNAGFSLNMAGTRGLCPRGFRMAYTLFPQAAFSSTVMELVRVVNELENSGKFSHV